jgi:hypothetical protein
VPLQDHMKLISTDDHVIEHPRVWLDRLPLADHELGPRIIDIARAGGSPAQGWLYEGEVFPSMALNAVAGKPKEEYGVDPTRFDELRLGAYVPEARVQDMDIDGVQAELCFPTFPRFCGTVFLKGKDKALARRCVQAWNDFIIDEWCSTAPDRLIPLILLPIWDVTLCVEEFDRCFAKGAKAISFPENPAALGLPRSIPTAGIRSSPASRKPACRSACISVRPDGPLRPRPTHRSPFRSRCTASIPWPPPPTFSFRRCSRSSTG